MPGRAITVFPWTKKVEKSKSAAKRHVHGAGGVVAEQEVPEHGYVLLGG
jgi:hypothetical protein